MGYTRGERIAVTLDRGRQTMNEQPPMDFGPWASSSQTRTKSDAPAPGGGLGAYRPHTAGHSAPKPDAPRRSPPVATPSPEASPAKTLPAHPLAKRRERPRYIYAKPSVRAFAAAIDGGLLALAVGPGVGLALGDRILLGVVVAMLGLLGLASVQSALTVAQGQSLAKRWLGLRLIDADGGRVGYVRGVLLRGALMTALYVASAGLLLLVELALLVRERLCVADRVAHTRVIEARTFNDPYVV